MLLIQHLLYYLFLHSLSLSRFTPHAQTVSFTSHTHIYPNALDNLSTLGLKKLFASTITHILRYRPFIINDIYYINKTSHQHQSKKLSARKSLCLFTNILNVKKKTAKRRVGAAKSKRKSMKVGNRLWTN